MTSEPIASATPDAGGDRLRGGARRLVLSDPARLDYISQGLTDITGYTREDLHDLFDDEYVRIVHPDDRDAFLAFDAEMRRGETTLSLEYRVVRKDGAVVRVLDTMNSHAMPDGTMVGYSLVALADEALQGEGANGASAPAADGGPGGAAAADVSRDVPYGLVVFTRGEHPVARANDRFWQMLGSNDPADALHRILDSNPISIIPAVDQKRFQAAAETARETEQPVTFETHLWHTGGYLVEMSGWLSYVASDDELGDEEGKAYRLALVDVTRERSRERESRRQLRVSHFKTIYDILFLFDVSQQTALCYRYDGDAPFDTSGSIRIMLSDAVDHLLGNRCAETSHDDLAAFLDPLRSRSAAPHASESAALARAEHMDGAQAHARRRHRLAFTALCDGQPVDAEAVLIDAEAGAYFFGCRRNPEAAEHADALAGEEGNLSEVGSSSATRLIVPTTESGTFAFAVDGGRARVLFSNDRGQLFCRGDLKPGDGGELETFLGKTPLSAGQLDQLGESGELALVDAQPNGTELAWRVVRQHEHGSQNAVVFAFEVPLWAASEDGTPDGVSSEAGSKVFVKTFGYFDVFVDGRAVVFNSAKSKELLALLVDRRGGLVSANEAISYLWEDEPANSVVLARHRKIAMRMKNTLADYGIEHIVRTTNGQRCLDVDAVQCDLYDYLAGTGDAKFSGTYMQNYSWGEVTLGELLTTMPFH